MAFGSALKEVLRQKHMTQQELSNAAGIAQSTISRLASGAIEEPSFETVIRIARATGVPLKEWALLAYGESTPETSDPNGDVDVMISYFRRLNRRGRDNAVATLRAYCYDPSLVDRAEKNTALQATEQVIA